MIPHGAAARTYYNLSPPAPHATGDVWKGLPSLSLCGNSSVCSGLVVTPACDLANHKTPSITYLPILGVREYLATHAGYSLARKALIQLLDDRLKINGASSLLPKTSIPNSDSIGLIEAELHSITAPSLVDAVSRTRAGLAALRSINASSLDAAIHLRQCLKAKDWRDLINRIATNSESDDIHFVPGEQPSGPWSAVVGPSVTLFRYPITVPRALLDLANDETDEWRTQSESIANASFRVAERPLKVLRLQKEFLSDLLTRFARLYVRIGSPDFTRDAVESFYQEIDADCTP